MSISQELEEKVEKAVIDLLIADGWVPDCGCCDAQEFVKDDQRVELLAARFWFGDK